jgi:large-conductance mechanosensitive channel
MFCFPIVMNNIINKIIQNLPQNQPSQGNVSYLARHLRLGRLPAAHTTFTYVTITSHFCFVYISFLIFFIFIYFVHRGTRGDSLLVYRQYL